MAANPGTGNLIAWWELNGTSGTRVDSHGSNDLTDNNTVGYAAGKKGNAADFEAANSEYLSIADNADLSFGDEDMSVCAWVKLESKPSLESIVRKGADPLGSAEWGIKYEGGATDRFRSVFSNGSVASQPYASTFGSPTLNTWYFVIAYHDSINNKSAISINAGPIDKLAYTAGLFDGSGALNIGASVGGGNYYDGLVDEVSIWSKVLSQEEIDWLYNGGAGRSYAELSNPSLTMVPMAATVLGPGVGLYDTRIKLRARARDVHLTTKVRNLR